MNMQEFSKRFMGKAVRIDGMPPGENSPYFQYAGEVTQARDVNGHLVEFSACGHTWTDIKHWWEMKSELLGLYTAYEHPELGPGIIRITLEKS